MYNWPNDYLFPVLDIVRLLLRKESLCSKIANFELLDKISQCLGLDNPLANKIMASRCLSNLITNSWGRGLFEAKFENLCYAVASIKAGNVSLQNAIATFYFNLSITQVETAVAKKSIIITKCISDFLCWAEQVDGILRAYEALGNLTTIIYKDDVSKVVKEHALLLELIMNHAKCTENDPHFQLRNVAKFLISKLNVTDNAT